MVNQQNLSNKSKSTNFLILFPWIAAATAELNQPFIELRNSLTTVVDAMRDFLTNIRVPELPNDADVDENESTDDEAHDDYLTWILSI